MFINKKIPLLEKNKIENLFLEYITYGGYPEIVLLNSFDEKIERLKDYSFDYIKKDIYATKIAN